jgi:hypothetical protein
MFDVDLVLLGVVGVGLTRARPFLPPKASALLLITLTISFRNDESMAWPLVGGEIFLGATDMIEILYHETRCFRHKTKQILEKDSLVSLGTP